MPQGKGSEVLTQEMQDGAKVNHFAAKNPVKSSTVVESILCVVAVNTCDRLVVNARGFSVLHIARTMKIRLMTRSCLF